MRKLRDYQTNCHEAISEALSLNITNQLVVMPTGLGKTFTACNYIEKNFEKILWLTHREELIDQSGLTLAQSFFPEAADEIEDLFERYEGMVRLLNHLDRVYPASEAQRFIKNRMGIIKESRMDSRKHIIVASVQTIHRRLDQIDPSQFDCVVIDEAHLFLSKTFYKSVIHFTPKLRLSLTATPYRLDGLSLSGIADEKVFEYDLANAIQNGYLVEIDGIQIKTNVNLDMVHTRGGEFINHELQNVVDCPERNNLIVDKYIEYASGKQIIFYCVNIEHAKNLADTFYRRGLHSVNIVVSDENICPDRKGVIRKFKRGEIDILTTVDILTTGFDYPALAAIGMVRPTKSLTVYIQSVGRGLRPIASSIHSIDDPIERKAAIKASGKPHLTLLDFVDVTSKHKLINHIELDKKKNTRDKVFMTSEKKDQIETAKAKRDAFINRFSDTDKRVELVPMPEAIISSSARMAEAATMLQLSRIVNRGLLTLEEVNENFYSKKDAAIIISSETINRFQVEYLRENGYDANLTTTIGEWSAAIEQINKAKEKLIKERKKQEL